MTFRTLAVAAVLASFTLACGPARPKTDGGVGGSGGSAGGTGGSGGNVGGSGGSAGSAGGAGGTGDSGVTFIDVTMAQARTAIFCTDALRITGTVVAIDDGPRAGTSGDITASFWVVDPAHPSDGLFVFKNYTDLPTQPFTLTVGDTVKVEGFLATVPNYVDRIGYRFELRNGCGTTTGTPLSVTVTGHATPPSDNVAGSGFGAGDGGLGYRANPEVVGTRVHIPGPLTLSQANPPEFKRVSALSSDTVYFGFKVSGTNLPAGVLVNNYKTFGTTLDGGSERCDWRNFANDGGNVTFPNGISGVWESYTHAPCDDGGTTNCRRNTGSVPSITGSTYTNVLYPQDCANDLPGAL